MSDERIPRRGRGPPTKSGLLGEVADALGKLLGRLLRALRRPWAVRREPPWDAMVERLDASAFEAAPVTAAVECRP